MFLRPVPASDNERDELAHTFRCFLNIARFILKMTYMVPLFLPVITTMALLLFLGSGAHCAYFDGKQLEDNNFGPWIYPWR